MKFADGLFALGAVLGTALFLAYYDAAFPAAAIDLQLSRSEIRGLADDYVRELEVDPDTFESALTFEVDGGAAVFLQRVLGLRETSRFARDELALWNWRARWFRSGEIEEYVLRLTPDGRALRFLHTIPEAAAGDSLSQDSALAIAGSFVTDELGIDLTEWRLEDQSTEARENRLDHSFTWELVGSEIEWRPDDPEAGTASRRLSVEVFGSDVGYFSQFLEVPEKFEREQSKETSGGMLLTLVSLALMAALVIAALVVAIVRYKREQIRWRPSLLLGAVVGAAVLVSGLLSYPLLKSGYPTEWPFNVYILAALIGVLIGAALYGLAVWVSAAAGESLSLESFPDALTALRDWVARRWFTRAAAVETLRGYAVGLAFLGYVTAFYLVGRRYLGVWLPAESPHSQLLGMYLPWLVPLLIATQAAVSEEVLFRLFAVPFFKRLLRVTFLALLIPAVIWALGHSSYPVYPVYVRGIELTIAGVVFGWVFIRYGLVTMLVAHYAIDAILLAMPLLRASGGSYLGYGVAALVCAALPLAVPLVVVLRRGARPPAT
ncbi:MAG: CPBP family intramembrane metalloprotease [Gemmatimonadota bacterium]|nr:MAG: CPBP family intramembrane metalloprotease [Gemmatimonadota bacterium]